MARKSPRKAPKASRRGRETQQPESREKGEGQYTLLQQGRCSSTRRHDEGRVRAALRQIAEEVEDRRPAFSWRGSLRAPCTTTAEIVPVRSPRPTACIGDQPLEQVPTMAPPGASQVRRPCAFPADSGRALAQIWQIAPGRPTEPNVFYCGVEPAALFESRDGGESWQPNKGLLNHEHQPKWQPGGGGLCLHTIVLDPDNPRRMLIAMSTGGVYRSDDGGKSWRARNVGVRAQFMPEEHRYPEFGQCVHKVVHHPSRPERLFLQNHWGLYRSDDLG